MFGLCWPKCGADLSVTNEIIGHLHRNYSYLKSKINWLLFLLLIFCSPFSQMFVWACVIFQNHPNCQQSIIIVSMVIAKPSMNLKVQRILHVNSLLSLMHKAFSAIFNARFNNSNITLKVLEISSSSSTERSACKSQSQT